LLWLLYLNPWLQMSHFTCIDGFRNDSASFMNRASFTQKVTQLFALDRLHLFLLSLLLGSQVNHWFQILAQPILLTKVKLFFHLDRVNVNVASD